MIEKLAPEPQPAAHEATVDDPRYTARGPAGICTGAEQRTFDYLCQGTTAIRRA
jgi:hypothetical protein